MSIPSHDQILIKSIPLTQGKIALVDDSDFEWLNKMKWTYCGNGYAYRKSPRPFPKSIYMHRLIMNPPSGLEVDHINGNKLDNQKRNLRLCNSSQNKMNQKVRADNTSGFRGVSFDKASNKWVSYINKSGKREILGYFETPEKAAEEYNKKAIKIFGDFALLNNIQ